jgi:hypothetical protein
MADVASAVGEINASLATLKRGSLVVFGDIFGGRIDNIHSAVSAAAAGSPSRLRVEFDEGESLDVWDPADFSFGPRMFRIQNASRVRWEWFYYGRLKTPANRFFIEHRSDGADVRAFSDADWAPQVFAPSLARAAVELLNGFDD